METYVEVPRTELATPWKHVDRKSKIKWRAPGGRQYKRKKTVLTVRIPEFRLFVLDLRLHQIKKEPQYSGDAV